MSGESLDITQQNIHRLKELFPEILTDGEKIDFDMLKTVLGETIEDKDERYQFTWHGKKETILGAQKPSKGTLIPVPEKSKNFDTTENLYIEGDNLEVLKLLQKSYNSKIKAIYIDPPYNTGRDFVYKDNFKDGVQSYLEQTGQVDSEGNILSTNSESNGRIHTDWLNMMYARLKLARNLLTIDGMIFISISDKEFHNLRKICDEIFGENNFVSAIIWEKKKKPSFLDRNIGNVTEYILIYSKNNESSHPLSIEKTEVGKKYPFNNAGNTMNILTFPSNSVNFTLEDGIIKAQDMSEGKIKTELMDDVFIEDGSNKNAFRLKGEWRYSQEKLDEIIKNNEKITISKTPFRPNHVKKGGEIKKIKNLFTINGYGFPTYEDADKEIVDLFNNKLFDYSKPELLIRKLLQSLLYNDENAIVLDFFSGSATTAEAVIRLNVQEASSHRFIMIQLPEVTNKNSESSKVGFKTICDIGEERIRRAGEKIKQELIEKQQSAGMLSEDEVDPEKLDIGFKVLKLEKSNIREWNVDFENLEDNLNLFETPFVEGRSEIDIVYEIMLKQGLELTYPIHTFEIDGKTVYDIAFGNLFICLSDNINTDIARAIIARRDEYGIETSSVIFSDAGFNNNDSEKLNCIELLKDAGYPEDNLLTI